MDIPSESPSFWHRGLLLSFKCARSEGKVLHFEPTVPPPPSLSSTVLFKMASLWNSYTATERKNISFYIGG